MRVSGYRSVVVLFLSLAVLSLAAGCDWLRFGFDTGGSRFSTNESSITTSNAPTLTTAWTGTTGGSIGTSSPVTSGGGNAFIASHDGKVYTFDENGVTNCSAAPVKCSALWTSAPIGSPIDSTPTVGDNGSLLVGGNNDKLYAYDSAGNTNCSGSPKVCQPLWTAAGTGGGDMSTPLTYNGIVYVHDASNLYAYDEAGNTNCAGTPTVCQPLWTASGVGSRYPLPVAWANNVVYTVGNKGLAAFDASGQTNCSGTPTVCQPLWTGPLGNGQSGVTTVGSLVYTAGASVYAYDAAGNTSCSGTPKVCQPLWSGVTGTRSQTFSPLAVANGTLYVEGSGKLVALDAAGQTNCSGTPAVCQPLWTGAIGAAASSNNLNSAPAVASGVVYIGSDDHHLYGFDAAGKVNCSGASCTPVWKAATGDDVRSSPSIANGKVLVGSNDHLLYAYVPFSIATTPALAPSFSANVFYYAVRCTGSSTTNVSTTGGGPVVIGGQTFQGPANVNVPLVAGQGLAVTAVGRTYTIRCLPSDFPNYTSTVPGHPQANGYLTTMTTFGTAAPYVIAFDNNGVPVWWYKDTSPPIDAQFFGTNEIGWWTGNQTGCGGGCGSGTYTIRNLSGQPVTSIGQSVNSSAGIDLHDFQQLPNGNYLGIMYVPATLDLSSWGQSSTASVIDCVIVELNPQSQIVWSWSTIQHINVAAENVNWRSQFPDIIHMNSVQAVGNQIVFSARHLDAVYDIDMTSGDILWKLGGTSTPESLSVTGNNTYPLLFSGQHFARELSDGTVSVHDNATQDSNSTEVNKPARVLRFQIDTTAHTANIVENVTDANNPVTSACCGSATKLAGGNWAVTWGASDFTTELNPQGQEQINITYPGFFSYRALPFPATMTDAPLSQGMDAMVPPVSLTGSATSSAKTSP